MLIDQLRELLPKNCDEILLAEFAQKLIDRCAQVAASTPCPYEDEFARQTYGHTWDMACVESSKNIRKHFGVK